MQTSRLRAVVGILLGMAVLATGWSSINMSLAEIQADLGASVLQLQWMMNMYGIFVCIPLLTVGKLGTLMAVRNSTYGGFLALAYRV